MNRTIPRARLIVVYGPNNLGKSTQVKAIAERLNQVSIRAEVIKYPILDLAPTGPRVNAALRGGLTLTDFELQQELAQNKRDFEPYLVEKLREGTWVIAEDYAGTEIAWGLTKGISLNKLEDMNKDLLCEDMGILLDGDRFIQGIERGHGYESDQSQWEASRKFHLLLARTYNWEIVNANQSSERVTNDIMKMLMKKIYLR